MIRASLLACFLALLVTAAAAGRKPNVVILLTDDQGTLDANCYGSTDLFTPAMDELARSGVRFTQSYAHTVCCPARAALLTGRHPQRGGIDNWTQGDANGPKGLNLPLHEVTLAEVLRDAGYRTALFGKWHLGADFAHGPTKQGFDVFFGHRGGFIDNFNHHFLHGTGFHDLYDGDREVFANGSYFPDLVTQRAEAFIEANREHPFFLMVAYNIPHYPEQPDPKFDDRYAGLPMPRRASARMISTTDDHMGRILAALERNGHKRDTIVAFMSDNGHSAEDAWIRKPDHRSGLPEGTYYGAHGGGGNTGRWRGHKNTFFEGGLRVPAIIRYPAALPAGAVRDQAVTAMDWMPTVLELCRTEPPPGVTLDGRSLLPVIREAGSPSPHPVLHWAWRGGWAVREGDWKLIGTGDKAEFLGNLAEPDPERTNHLEQRPDLVRRLAGLHEAWAEEMRPQPQQ
ncbi:MAG TPA: sulfatase-like hydrolase/transferase [Luteolibacter sp.]|nr:sulfatase-like hydrolase/transferase [Luteolibacter sp.]